MPERQVYSVAGLVGEMRSLLEASYRDIWIEGEISGLATPSSGHIYFSLKEDGAIIRCAFFRNRRAGSANPEEGMQVLVRGQVSIYPNRGDLQLIVRYLEPAGEGALRRAFEILKKKLLAEGLFDPGLRKPLPAYPQTIGVVTSAGGAALHDILVTLRRRYPPARVIVFPTLVQGDGAADAIAAMLGRAAENPRLDVVLLARGGGSLEDLQAFNEERVARAIHACPHPVVTGVGHETDITIADLVADHRAATPTAAAEMATPLAAELFRQIRQQQRGMTHSMTRRLGDLVQQVDHARARLVHPAERLRRHVLELSSLESRLQNRQQWALADRRQRIRSHRQSLHHFNPANRLGLLRTEHRRLNQRLLRAGPAALRQVCVKLDAASAALRLLGPEQTLSRGYAVLRNHRKEVVSSVTAAAPGESLDALLADGSLRLKVADD